MKLSILASLFLAGSAVAAGGGGDSGKTIKNGDPCTQDGKMGACESGYCKQKPDDKQGTCAPKN